MNTLVTVQQAGEIIQIMAWAGPLAGLLIGIAAGFARGKVAASAWQGLAIGLLGPIIWGLWLVYSHLVRYNPETGQAGLHSVTTLALSALIFTVAGIAMGSLYRKLVFRPRTHEETDTTADHAEND